MTGYFVYSGEDPNSKQVGMIVSRVLSSWKEIGLYLGKGVRTVQRWERTDGLPVHRPRPFAVVAHTAEIDHWISNRAADAGTGPPETRVSDVRRVSMFILKEHPCAAELKAVLERAGCEVVAVHKGQASEASADASRADVLLAISFETSKQATTFETSKQATTADTMRPQAARDTSSSVPSDSPSQFS